MGRRLKKKSAKRNEDENAMSTIVREIHAFRRLKIKRRSYKVLSLNDFAQVLKTVKNFSSLFVLLIFFY